MSHVRVKRGWRWGPAATVLMAGLLVPALVSAPATHAATPTGTAHHLTDPTARTPRAAAPLVDPGSGVPVRGVDTSQLQHPNDAAIDWGAVAASGKTFAFVKATEGATDTDPWFTRDFADAAAAGVYRGPYHVFTPGDPVAQARFFVKAIDAAGYFGWHAGELPPAIGLAWNADGTCPAYTAADVVAFATMVQTGTARTPLLYTQQSFLDTCLGGSAALNGQLLWTVDVNQSPPPVVAGFRTWTLWQYGIDTVPGILTATDVDAFNGAANVLAGLANIGHMSSLNGDNRADFVAYNSSAFIMGTRNFRGFAASPFEPFWTMVGYPFADNPRVRFADLDGDGKTELIWVRPDGLVQAWHNENTVGNLKQLPWSPASVIIASGFTDPARARFPDLDGDGKADVAYTQVGGNVEAWHNVNGFASYPWAGSSVVLATGFTTPSRVNFTDLDSDGKAEALYLQTTGEVTAWRNVGGFASLPWDATSVTIASGFSDPSRVWFPDVDGDGKAEAVYLQGDGSVQAWHNVAGFAEFPWSGGDAVTLTSGFPNPARIGFA